MEFADFGWDNQMGDIPLGFSPSDIANLELWTRYNQGITETGLGVSQWDDVSGNGNHLKQATDLDRPQKQADGSVLFDGISQFLKADAFTLVQPETVYLLAKQVSWGHTDRVFDGNALNSGAVFQLTTTPSISIYAGTTAAANTDWAVGAYEAVVVIFNGASSSAKVGSNSEITGDAGAADMGGFTLAAAGDGTAPGNIQVKEVLVYSEAHDAATRAQVIAYLQSI